MCINLQTKSLFWPACLFVHGFTRTSQFFSQSANVTNKTTLTIPSDHQGQPLGLTPSIIRGKVWESFLVLLIMEIGGFFYHVKNKLTIFSISKYEKTFHVQNMKTFIWNYSLNCSKTWFLCFPQTRLLFPNTQQCSEMLSNAQQCSAMLSNAQQCSSILSNAKQCSAMLKFYQLG